MRPDSVEAVTDSWNEANSEDRKELIRLFLELHGSDEHEFWIDFLCEQFGLPTAVSTPAQPAAGRLNPRSEILVQRS